MRIIIDESLDGVLLRNMLKSRLGFSQSMITFLKAKENGILVDGVHVTVRHVLRKGEIIELSTADDVASERIKPVNLPIDIIFEDEHVLAVNKPYSLPVHPSKKLQDDTLAGRVVNYISPLVFRCVTRLDKDTSGAVLIAKDKPTAAVLTGMTERREIQKTYIAVVKGEGRLPENGRINLNIRRKPPSFVEREVIESKVCGSENDPCGCRAETRFEIISERPPYYLLRVFPLTGRTHQLRVHFSGVGFPIVGDTLYGGDSPLIARQALHAVQLSFIYPPTGEKYTFFAPLHEDFRAVLRDIFNIEGDISDLL